MHLLITELGLVNRKLKNMHFSESMGSAVTG